MQNYHDQMFKATFGEIEVAKDFLINYLPEDIIKLVEIEHLEIQKDSFITEELQEMYSDMLFKTNISGSEGYIYLLFEHKSYQDKYISLQLLKYMVQVWELQRKKKEGLSLILPLVIYHGNSKWSVNREFSSMFKEDKEVMKKLQEYIPEFKYILYDLSKYTDKELKGAVILRLLFVAFKYNGLVEVDKFLIILEELITLSDDDPRTGKDYLRMLFEYILRTSEVIEWGDLKRIVDKTGSQKGSEAIMTGADKLIEKGRQEGRQEIRLKLLKDLRAKNMPLEEIMELLEVSKEEIEVLKNNE